MKKKTYTRNIQKLRRTQGCMTDCVAYYFNLHPENVPFFIYPRENWGKRFRAYFKKKGYKAFWVKSNKVPKRGMYLVVGDSLVWKTASHMVVYKNGKCIYDPTYPSQWKDGRITHYLEVTPQKQLTINNIKEMEKEKYFVVLSQGAYSDYSPDYYMGDIEITQKELDTKGAEVGDMIIAEFEKLPERPFSGEYNYSNETIEKYDPQTDKKVWQPGFNQWKPLMEKWLEEKGYKKIPNDLPEINVSYSDIPHN